MIVYYGLDFALTDIYFEMIIQCQKFQLIQFNLNSKIKRHKPMP